MIATSKKIDLLVNGLQRIARCRKIDVEIKVDDYHNHIDFIFRRMGHIPKTGRIVLSECTNTYTTIAAIEDNVDRYFRGNFIPYRKPNTSTMSIEKVIFNDPATIVFWTDGTKTVVKAYDDEFDPEKGLAMAISKKALGNQGNYYETFKKYLPEEMSLAEFLNKKLYTKPLVEPGDDIVKTKAIELIEDIFNKALEGGK